MNRSPRTSVLRPLVAAVAVAVALVSSVSVLLITDPVLPAFASNGRAQMTLYASPVQSTYGTQDVILEAELEDRSGSCIYWNDCNAPAGTVYFLNGEHDAIIGSVVVQPERDHYGFSFANLTLHNYPAGYYNFEASFRGTFDDIDSWTANDIPISQHFEIDSAPCTATISVDPANNVESRSAPLFTLDLGSGGHVGSVKWYSGTGQFWGATGLVNGQTASFQFPYAPSQSLSMHGVYVSANNNYTGCTSPDATFQVITPTTGSGEVRIPQPEADFYTIDLGTTLTDADVTHNDSLQGSPIALRLPTQNEIDHDPTLAPQAGTASIVDGIYVSFTPPPGWDGTTIDFAYFEENTDNERGNFGRVHVTGRCAVGKADGYTVAHDTALTAGAPGVLANDGQYGCAGPVEVVTAPSNGSVVLNADGSFVYTPNSGFQGPDSFAYAAQSDPAQRPVTVTLTVGGETCVPALTPDTFDVTSGTLTLPAPGVGGNDMLCRNAVEVLDPPQHGSVQLAPDGSFIYQATPGYSGADMFTYHVRQATTPQLPQATAGRAEDQEPEPAAGPSTAPASVTLNIIPSVDTSTSTQPTTDPPATDPTATSVAAATTTSVAAATTTSVAAATTTSVAAATATSVAPATATNGPTLAVAPGVPPGPIELPSTGATSDSALVIAASAIPTGVILVLIARRRRPRLVGSRR